MVSAPGCGPGYESSILSRHPTKKPSSILGGFLFPSHKLGFLFRTVDELRATLRENPRTEGNDRYGRFSQNV